MKTCTKCKQSKPLAEFLKNKTCQDGFQTECRECMRKYQRSRAKTPQAISRNREYQRQYYHLHKTKINKRRKVYSQTPSGKLGSLRRHIRNKYKMDLNSYSKMKDSQNAACAICGELEADNEMGKILCVDHNHETGAIRELICFHCNSALGFARENILTLQTMIKYLNKHNMEL